MLKSPTFWGSIIAIVLTVGGLIFGIDLKKMVCEAPAPVSIVK